jgi:hypothetical protein
MDELLKLVILALCAGAGGFLGSYLKRKGENLATHEDIDKLVEQVRAVTTATKEIEAKISSDVWDRQKRWEVKREVIFEVTKRIALVQDKLGSLQAVYQTESEERKKGKPEWPGRTARALAEFSEAANNLDQATLPVSLACGAEVRESLFAFLVFTRQLAVKITEGNLEVFMASIKELLTKSNAVTVAMRKEIGV